MSSKVRTRAILPNAATGPGITGRGPTSSRIKVVALSVALACAGTSAHAVLERSGPTNAWGFPAWYQDTTGVALEYCNVSSQAELDGGHCLLLPGDTTVARDTAAGVDASYFDEHFWWSAGAIIASPVLIRAELVLAAEAAFANAPAANGDQISFTRIRVRLDPAPVSGVYKFYHPYGVEEIEAVAGERIFFTDDVGINCPPGQFDCAMQGRVGPFLLPATVAADGTRTELPPANYGGTPGKLYIADPALTYPVTGSPEPDFMGNDGLMHNHNVFRIEGPPGADLDGAGNNFLETRQFSLTGRVFTGVMPGRIEDVRANYADDGVSGKKVDVFLTAQPTAQARVPGNPQPAVVNPATSFFDKPCQPILDANGNVTGLTAPSGSLERLMKAYQTHRWGQVLPSNGVLPPSVCIKDNTGVDLNGNTVATYQEASVRDEVSITKAFYDPISAELVVEAKSSDTTVPGPVLTLKAFGRSFDLNGGVITLTGVTAPPESVIVTSSNKGSASQRIDTGVDTGSGGGGGLTPEANNDFAQTLEDTQVDIDVLAGDAGGVGKDTDVGDSPVVTIVAPPGFGTATVDPATNRVSYLPQANANGTDVFTYLVTAGGIASNIASVTVNVAPVNDPPVAVNDSAVGNAGANILITPLTNDTDIDHDVLKLGGTATLGAISGPAGAIATATADPATGTIAFTADLAGTYTFTYQASDAEFAATGTVTVITSPADTLSVATAEYRSDKNRWKVVGTSAVSAPHDVTIYMTNCGTATSPKPDVLLGTVVADLNAFALDTTTAPSVSVCAGTQTRVKVTSSLGGAPVVFTPRIR